MLWWAEKGGVAVKKNPEVDDIIHDWLIAHGYDGLYHSDTDCGCRLDNLIPCNAIDGECQAGYLDPCDCSDGHDFHVGPKEDS